jgi:predicted Zn-dependent peptidase
VAQVAPEDLKRFHDQHYRPGNTILGAIGDFKAGDMRALIEKYFAVWSGAAEPPLSVTPKVDLQPAKISSIVPRPCRLSSSAAAAAFAGPIPSTTPFR